MRASEEGKVRSLELGNPEWNEYFSVWRGGADMQKLELKMSLPNFLFLLFSELTSLKDKWHNWEERLFLASLLFTKLLINDSETSSHVAGSKLKFLDFTFFYLNIESCFIYNILQKYPNGDFFQIATFTYVLVYRPNLGVRNPFPRHFLLPFFVTPPLLCPWRSLFSLTPFYALGKKMVGKSLKDI
jgi:hypothetical protein